MNCTEFNHYLDEGIDQALGDENAADTDVSAAFEAHLAGCESCKAVFDAQVRMMDSLRAMPVPDPGADFEDRVLANAFKANTVNSGSRQKHHHRQGFMVGFGSAAAAALALWIGVGMPTQEPSPTATATKASEQRIANMEAPEQKTETATQMVAAVPASAPMAKAQVAASQPVLSIALNTQKKVKLAFASSQALQGAKITIRLPDNVALVGYPGRRQLSWETNLKQGDNLLSLPVIATQVASGELIADIEYKGQVKTLRVNLQTNAAGARSTSGELDPFVG